MSTPIHWKPATFLHVFGNTPAFSLAQHLAAFSLAQHLEPADATDFLLLGCGDARNVLYTLYASGADKSNRDSGIFDFTCVDIEPAVLARNAILYSLLVDDPTLGAMDRIWSIYYDMKLNAAALDLVHAQCEKLIYASESLDTWAASPYSKFMNVSTAHTLAELRRLWNSFLSTRDDQAMYNERFRVGAASTFAATKQRGDVVVAIRAGGALWGQAVKCAATLHETYWTTGATTSNSNAVNANPTFAFALSGLPFPLQGASVPCVGFHLETALAMREQPTIKDIYDSAKAQFSAWCKAFADAASSGRVMVRFCVGDAITVCRALARDPSSTAEVRLYAPWSSVPVELLPGGPRRFSAIDTSNLVDPLGLLNVLVCASPLLSGCPSAVLYTETLLGSAGIAPKAFRSALCGDVSAMSLVLGLAPSAYIDGYTTLSTAHQIMFSRMQSDDANSHERIVWRRTPYIDQSLLHFDKHSELAELLHKVYYEMFDCEDIALARQVKSGVKSNSILQRMSNITYTRHSFVSLLAAFRRRLSPETDWTSVANGIVDRVGRDNRLMIGMNSYQDLCAHLHAAGLLDVVPLYHSPQVPQDVYKSRTVFANWSDEEIGHLVYVGLRIRVRDMARAEGLASPLLFTVRTPAALNYSATFYALHGSVTVDPTSKTFDVQTSSDRSHDVIAIARVPAWTLMVDPDTTTVEMGVRPGALNGPAIFRTLGMSMAVFSAPLADTANVFFSRSPPTVGGVPLAPFIEEYVPSVSNSELEMRTVSVTLDSRREGVASLTLREDVTGEEERAKWTDKVDVRAVQVSSTDGVVETVCGTFSRPLHFTLPVDLKDAKLRIARKSFYVEVVAPVARIVPPSALPMHRVILDRLPIAEDRTNHPMKWLDMHGQFSFSDRERANRERFFNGGRAPFVEFKDDLFVLLMRCAGFQNPVRVFFLLDESKGSGSDFLAQTHAVIFVSALKWDSTASTIVADAYVISHPDEETLEMLAASGVKAGQLPHPHATATLWDNMLIGFAKRCGNGTWFHKASCSRPTAALCGCGAGVDVGGFKAVKEWKGVPAEKVTRAAIGMLFAPHFLENVGGHMPNFATSMGIPVARPPPTGTTSSRVHVPVSATTAEPAGQCARCGNDARLECPKCGKVKYCDKNCMRVHAKAHKSACK